MKKYIQYISEFHENNPKEIDFVNNHLKKHLAKNPEDQTEIETILDYLYSNPKVDISKIGYSTILEKTEKWHKKLQSVSTKNNEVEGEDYEIFLDYGDGFRIVKLVSKPCYEREGKFMSHCVASYYGRNSKIYSLRDSKNFPHCTIEDGNQIKGKGNGKIDPKYIDYIVKFLEKTGMIVGENEMKNLGYHKIESIDEGLTSDGLYNGYIYEGKIDTIKDEEGDIYSGFGLLNIKKYVEIDVNMKIKWNFDLSVMLKYFFKKVKATSGDNSTSATSGYKSTSATSGDCSTSATSGNYSTSATSGNYSTSATSGDCSTSATSGDKSTSATSGNYSTSATSGEYSTSATSGDCSTSATSVDYSTSATSGYNSTSATSGNYSTSATSGNYSTSATSGYNSTSATSGYKSTSATSGYNSTSATSGDNSTSATSGDCSTSATSGNYSTSATSGYNSTSVANGKYNIAVANGHESKAKGKIGNFIVLSEYEYENGEVIYFDVKSAKIDGEKIKEDTLYMLKEGKFIETK